MKQVSRRIFWIIALLFIGTVTWSMISDMLASDSGTVMTMGVVSIIGVFFGYVGYYKEIDYVVFGIKTHEEN
jgi:hypothetical protein